MEICSRNAFQNDHNYIIIKGALMGLCNTVENAYFSVDVFSALGTDNKYVLGKNLD